MGRREMGGEDRREREKGGDEERESEIKIERD